MLAKTSEMCHFDWDLMIPGVVSAYRATKHSVLGVSPNLMIYGRELMEPVDLELGIPRPDHEESTVPQYVLDLQDRLEKAHRIAREELQKSVERAKKHYGRKLQFHKYQTGDPVWYYIKGTKRQKGRVPKFLPYFDGPYFVLDSLDDVVYIIQKGPRTKPKVVHHDKLKAFKPREPLDNAWVFKEKQAESTGDPGDLDPGTSANTLGGSQESPSKRPKRVTKAPDKFGEWVTTGIRTTAVPHQQYGLDVKTGQMLIVSISVLLLVAAALLLI